MTRTSLLVLVTVSAVLGSQSVFSVHDDILAFPQYDVILSDTFISNADAHSRLASAISSSSAPSGATSETLQAVQGGRGVAYRAGNTDERHAEQDPDYIFENAAEMYEGMILEGKRYLCSIPVVKEAVRNETLEAAARVEEEKEMARATIRGWELLKEMEGHCLYYIVGYWSYSFCYNGKVTQFHHLPPQKDVPLFPPQEDRSVPSFILGDTKGHIVQDGAGKESGGEAGGKVEEGPTRLVGTQLQAKGEMRYLVQKLDGGTECDLTGKDRQIEVQFHCHEQSNDRIGWIKEVATCSYLMIIYTPRLCHDAAFRPPRENRANPIACREVLEPHEVEGWKTRKASEAERKTLKGSDGQESNPIIVGGIQVAAANHVGKIGRRIEFVNPAEAGPGKVEIIAQSLGNRKGGKYQRLTDEDLKNMDIDPGVVDSMRKELQELAGDRGWKLEVVDRPGGRRDIHGVLSDEPAKKGKGTPEEEDSAEGDESAEGYPDKL